MKIELGDVSGLPEALKPLVSEADGKFTLDLAQVAPSNELERFKGKALKAEQEAIERRKALDGWKGLGETPEAVQQALQEAQKGKGASEDQEKLVAQLKDAATQREKALLAQISQMRTETTQGALKAELAKAGVVPEGLDLLAGFASSRIAFDDDGSLKVLTKDGSAPMVGSGANGGATLADLAKELAGAIPHLVSDGGKGGGGKLPGTNGATPESKTVTRAEWDKMDHSRRAEFSKSGGKVING